jgi:hypothetical protein
MKSVRYFSVIAIAALTAHTVRAQDFPKPGPEHEILKKMAGDWDFTMKIAGGESKGKVTYKMELGGMWLVSSLEGEIFGTKFYGKGLDSYDAKKKKYVSAWFDSMSSTPMVMEGTYDKEKKTLTLEGEGPGMDGKPTKQRSISVMPDDDMINFSLYMGDTKEPTFTIVYKRKKS